MTDSHAPEALGGRCGWCGTDPLYVAYHDTEWGVPEYDSRALWEKLILDGFQAGLSWITILRKRENYRRALDDFDAGKDARYTAAETTSVPSRTQQRTGFAQAGSVCGWSLL